MGGGFESIIWVSKFNLVELLQPDHILDLLHVLILLPQKINGKNRLEALWRALAMNYDNVDYGPAAPVVEESFVAWFKIRILSFLKSIKYQDCTTDFEHTICQLDQESTMERSLNEIIGKFQFYTVGGSGHEYEQGLKHFHRHLLRLEYLQHRWLTAMSKVAFGRCLFTTENGLLGSGLDTIQRGDQVWLLCDGHTPFVLRPTDRAFSFNNGGACYLNGLMNGEMLEDRWGVKERIGCISIV